MMTDRERWTVYPLLFLALGAALRPKFVPTTEMQGVSARSLSCEELLVAGQDHKPRLRMSSHKNQGPRLEVFDADGRLVLILATDREGRAGIIQPLINWQIMAPLDPDTLRPPAQPRADQPQPSQE